MRGCGAVGGGRGEGKEEEEEEEKNPPARLASVQKALQLTHLVLIFQS